MWCVHEGALPGFSQTLLEEEIDAQERGADHKMSHKMMRLLARADEVFKDSAIALSVGVLWTVFFFASVPAVSAKSGKTAVASRRDPPRAHEMPNTEHVQKSMSALDPRHRIVRSRLAR